MATPKPQAQQSQPRKARPNYNYVHRNLLPVEIYPLPPLIPHNPVSLVAAALSYLYQFLNPPIRIVYGGCFSSETSSVHVTDPKTARALWEMGFFGKGSLSRSEPTWLETQRHKGSTAEENTGKRRGERREQKFERARLEQEGIAKQMSIESSITSRLSAEETTNNYEVSGSTTVEAKSASTNSPVAAPSSSSEHVPGYEEWKRAVETTGLPTPPPTITSSEIDRSNTRPVQKLQRSKSVRFSPTIEAREFDLSSPVISPIKAPGSSSQPNNVDVEPKTVLENQEHLHLSLEETFFLSYGLGVLNVYCENTETVLPPSSLLALFRQHSYAPPRSLSAPEEPDDPFMISYVVYHHYRSLGWVVRSGVKFSTDYLLYNRGPAFSHADFAVVIIPSYSHNYWHTNNTQRREVTKRSKGTWWWLHCINRVQAQVQKQLVLCYVEIPPPLSRSAKDTNIDIGKQLGRYRIRDIGIRRWTPNRSRD